MGTVFSIMTAFSNMSTAAGNAVNNAATSFATFKDNAAASVQQAREKITGVDEEKAHQKRHQHAEQIREKYGLRK